MCEFCGSGPTCGVCGGRGDEADEQRTDRPDGGQRIDRTYPDGATAIELYDVYGRLTAYLHGAA